MKNMVIYDLTNAALISGSPVTNIGFGPVDVGQLKSFSSYVTHVANSSVTAVAYLSYQFGPFQDGPYTEITATSVNTGAQASSVLTVNHFANNYLPWMKIVVGTSKTAGFASGTIRAIIVGKRE